MHKPRSEAWPLRASHRARLFCRNVPFDARVHLASLQLTCASRSDAVLVVARRISARYSCLSRAFNEGVTFESTLFGYSRGVTKNRLRRNAEPMDFNAIFAVAVFLIVIALVMSEKVHRSLVAIGGAAVLLLAHVMTLDQAVRG